MERLKGSVQYTVELVGLPPLSRKETYLPKPWTNQHIPWLVKINLSMTTVDGRQVEVWELRHQDDDEVLSAWARHFRNHYCLDTEIDVLRHKKSRRDYLNTVKFPSKTSNLGPAIRAADFGEILVADYLEWVLSYWVPRVRWDSKSVRDESSKGSDVIGFRFHDATGTSVRDTMAVCECKTRLSRSSKNGLQEAINGSAKDHLRIDESLNYIKQRLLEKSRADEAKKVERFQDPVDSPYDELYGAVLVAEEQHLDEAATSADTAHVSTPGQPDQPHPKRDKLLLVVIKGSNLMALVHELYRRAADEA